MPIQRHEIDFATLPEDVLERWRALPPAVVSDCMNRTQVMAGAIKPVGDGMRLVGQARTVTCMVGDNSAIHTALAMVRRGEVLVVDAGGYEDTAIWGGIMTRAALQRGIAGLVVDGAVRDVAEIREFGFPCFARAVVPAGPHKGFRRHHRRPYFLRRLPGPPRRPGARRRRWCLRGAPGAGRGDPRRVPGQDRPGGKDQRQHGHRRPADRHHGLGGAGDPRRLARRRRGGRYA